MYVRISGTESKMSREIGIIIISVTILLWSLETNAKTCDLSYRNIKNLNTRVFENCSRSDNILNLRGNNLTIISNTSFLNNSEAVFYRLEELDLSDNAIRYIHFDSFFNLPFLKMLNCSNNVLEKLENGILNDKYQLVSVDFSYNQINDIGTDVFFQKQFSLRYVNISYNKMTYFEPWPYRCPSIVSFDLSNNEIHTFTNRMNWTYDIQEPYITHVDMRFNMFRHWNDSFINQYSKGGDIFAELATYLLEMEGNPWVCDCNFHHIVRRFRNSFYRYSNTPYIYVLCMEPPHLRGISVFEDVPLDDFICNRTKDCPSESVCQDRPERQILEVSCNNCNYTALPEVLPQNKYGRIQLSLNYNEITSIIRRNYTQELVHLSVAHNAIKKIERGAVSQMTQLQYLNIEDNSIQRLPDNMQFILRYEYVFMGNNPYICDCDMVWMADWVNNAPLHSNESEAVKCIYNEKEQYDITQISKHLLNCTYDVLIGLAVAFGIVLSTTVVIGVWAKRCPYETKVLVYKYFRYHPRDKYEIDQQDGMKNDIYISFDDEDIFVRQWVHRRLVRKLEEEKPFYKIFLPTRDLHIARVKADEIIEEIEKSKRILIVLSEKYDDNDWCKFECDRADILDHSEGRIMCIKYHRYADVMIENEPWKSRVKDKKVLTLGNTSREENWFWNKLKYELPVT